jgi:hypothetical protein
MTGQPDPPLEDLLAIACRFHPTGALDVEPGYAELPEVRARRAVQEAAPGGAEWTAFLGDLKRLFPSARLLDHSTLHLCCARHVRVMRDPEDPGHHLVAWVSVLAPVALVYESRHTVGQKAKVLPPGEASDTEGIQQLQRAVQGHGWRVLPWDVATHPVPGVAVGNLLPGQATLASCLFSDFLW